MGRGVGAEWGSGFPQLKPQTRGPLPPAAHLFFKPSRRVSGEGETPAPYGRGPRAVQRWPGRRRGASREASGGGGGRGEGGGRGRVMACLSAPVSALEGACVAVGVASPPGVCLLAEVSVCLSQGVWALPGPPAVFWGARLWAHPAVLRADAADVAGPQLCRLPGEGEGLQSAPPIMAAKCQGEGMGTGWEGGPIPATPHPGRPPPNLCSWLGLFPLPGS